MLPEKKIGKPQKAEFRFLISMLHFFQVLIQKWEIDASNLGFWSGSVLGWFLLEVPPLRAVSDDIETHYTSPRDVERLNDSSTISLSLFARFSEH